MASIRSELRSASVLKVPLAILINYIPLFVFHSAEGSFLAERPTPYIHLSAGIAFLTILLLGSAGAAATFIAAVLHFAQIPPDVDWNIFFQRALVSIVLQYMALKICLRLLGMSSRLRGLSFLELITLSAIFSIAYTLSTVFLVYELRENVLLATTHAALSDFLGVLSCLGIIKLVSAVRKRLPSNFPPDTK